MLHAAAHEVCYAPSFNCIVLEDYAKYYHGTGIPSLVVGLAIAGTLANTTLDSNLQRYWQAQIRSDLTNNISDAFEFYSKAAQWKISLPLYLVSMSLTSLKLGSPFLEEIACWGNHSLRTLLLAAPQQAVLTQLLGSGRPPDQSPHWQWTKHDRAVSGHAFYGAIPFLNLAEQHPSPLIKVTGYALSVLPALARLNQNKHYTSQVFLGWWLAFSATRFVWHANIVRKPQLTYFMLPSKHAIYLCVIAKL